MHLLEYSAFIIFYSPLIKEKILLLHCWSMPRLPLAVLCYLVPHIPHTLNHHTKEHQELISRISSNLSSPGKGHSWLMMHVRYQYCIIRNTDSIQIWLKGQNLSVAAPPSSYYLAHKPALQVHMNVSTKFAIKSCVSIWASSLITIVFAVPLRNCFVNVRVQIQLTSMLQQCKHCAVSRLVTTP